MRFNKHNLEVARVAGVGSNKPELAAVLFTKEATVATDSFKLVKITTPKGNYPGDLIKAAELPPVGVMVHADVVKTIKLPKEPRNLEFKGAGSMVIESVEPDLTPSGITLTTFDMEKNLKERLETSAIMGKYPDFKETLDKAELEDSVQVSLSIYHLMEILKVADKFTKNTLGMVTVRVPKAKYKPLIFKASGGDKQELTGLLMPMNVE